MVFCLLFVFVSLFLVILFYVCFFLFLLFCESWVYKVVDEVLHGFIPLLFMD